MMLLKRYHDKDYSKMFMIRRCSIYIRPQFRLLSSYKKTIVTCIFVLAFIYFVFPHRRNRWCDPTKPLWWFCPPPDQTTVCSWHSHFQTAQEQTDSPESYDRFLSSLPIVQPSFEFNNATLTHCSEKSIDILLFVVSKCSHFSIRQSIRRTWGNTYVLAQYFPHVSMKLLFLIDVDTQSKNNIELEHRLSQDLVQVTSLPEQYELVTHREAALYTFATERCHQARYIFKTDDDIFVNTFLLPLVQRRLNETLYSLVGFYIKHGLVIRHSADQVGRRYIITHDEYACARYPTFLSGFGYLMSFRTCSLLIRAYQRDSRPFPLSDVYFTGLLAEMMNIQREEIFNNVEYRYETKCNEQFFIIYDKPFACAAGGDHFNDGTKTKHDKSLMNEYNLYWIKLREKYDSKNNDDR